MKKDILNKIKITPLKIINLSAGNVMHGLKRKDLKKKMVFWGSLFF